MTEQGENRLDLPQAGQGAGEEEVWISHLQRESLGDTRRKHLEHRKPGMPVSGIWLGAWWVRIEDSNREIQLSNSAL